MLATLGTRAVTFRHFRNIINVMSFSLSFFFSGRGDGGVGGKASLFFKEHFPLFPELTLVLKVLVYLN